MLQGDMEVGVVENIFDYGSSRTFHTLDSIDIVSLVSKLSNSMYGIIE